MPHELGKARYKNPDEIAFLERSLIHEFKEKQKERKKQQRKAKRH